MGWDKSRKNPDVDEESMKMSDSNSKYIFAACQRQSYRLDLKKVNITLIQKSTVEINE